jgi:hypothetical protein
MSIDSKIQSQVALTTKGRPRSTTFKEQEADLSGRQRYSATATDSQHEYTNNSEDENEDSVEGDADKEEVGRGPLNMIPATLLIGAQVGMLLRWRFE